MNTWLHCFHPRAEPRVRVVCVPHAGGAASMFAEWHEHLPEEVEVWAVQLPGREDRLLDTPVSSVSELAATLGPKVATLAADGDVALLGSCLGAVVVYEVARWLRDNGAQQPKRFVAAAHPGPSRMNPPTGPLVHTLPDHEVLAAVGDAAGTDPQLLADPEILELILPALRADARAHETYEYRRTEPLDVDVLALAGLEDSEVSKESLDAWSVETRGACRTQLVPGGHFFFKTHAAEALTVVGEWLLSPTA